MSLNSAIFEHNLSRYVVRQMTSFNEGKPCFSVLWTIYINKRLKSTRTKYFTTEVESQEYYKEVLNNIINHLPL